jgi:hypothetical protein
MSNAGIKMLNFAEVYDERVVDMLDAELGIMWSQLLPEDESSS